LHESILLEGWGSWSMESRSRAGVRSRARGLGLMEHGVPLKGWMHSRAGMHFWFFEHLIAEGIWSIESRSRAAVSSRARGLGLMDGTWSPALWDILGLPWEVIGLSFGGLLAVASHPGHLKGLRVRFSSICCVIADGLCFPVCLSTQARCCCKSNCREYSYNKRTHAL